MVASFWQAQYMHCYATKIVDNLDTHFESENDEYVRVWILPSSHSTVHLSPHVPALRALHSKYRSQLENPCRKTKRGQHRHGAAIPPLPGPEEQTRWNHVSTSATISLPFKTLPQPARRLMAPVSEKDFGERVHEIPHKNIHAFFRLALQLVPLLKNRCIDVKYSNFRL